MKMWTLALILGVTALFVTKLIGRVVAQIKRPAYPSDGLIDQVLPLEILEHIFFNLDYESLLKCSNVNKYWQYITSSEQFRNRFFTFDTTWRIDPYELLENWNYNRRELLLEKLNWLEYPESYDPEWKHQDQLLARKLGKKLIDVDFNTAQYIQKALDIPLDRRMPHPMHKWLVKFRAKTLPSLKDEWVFEPINNKIPDRDDYILGFSVRKKAMPPYFTFKHNADCEFIVDLAEMNLQSYGFTKIHRVRYINEKSPWCGLSLDRSLFNIMGALFIPCLLNDYWKLNSSVHYWVNLIFAVISVLSLVLVMIGLLFDQYRINNYNTIDRPRRRVFLAAGSVFASFLVLYYNYGTWELGFMFGSALGCIGYFFMVLDLYNKRHRYAKHVIIISSLLVIFMLDWNLNVKVIRSGKIFTVLAYNTGLYLMLGVIMMVHNAFMVSLQNLEPLSTTIRQWNKKALVDFAFSYLAVLFITLYAPDTTSKVKL